MIKVMNLVALIMAPIVVQTQTPEATLPVLLIAGIGLILIVWSVRSSDREETAEDHQPIKASGD
jgi:hypothetical protein